MKQNREERKESITKQRQEQILDAAIRVFSKRGFTAATTAEIAKTAGIAEGTIYNYYKNKRDLFISAMHRYIVPEPIVGLIQRAQTEDDSNLISALVNDRLSRDFREMDIFLLLMSELYRDKGMRQQYLEDVTNPIINELEKYLKSIVSSGRARPMNIEVTARILVGLMIGLVIVKKVEGEQGPLNRLPSNEVVSEITRYILSGLQTKCDKA